MELLYYLLIATFGLVAGSFISAMSYRIPRDLPLLDDRSRCPKCKKKISWYDNIPLFSFFFLGGKCRNCKKKISIRYPLLELSTASIFVVTYIRFDAIRMNVPWLGNSIYSLVLVLLLVVVMITIFMTDIEQMIIPDKLVFIAYLLMIIGMLWMSYGHFYENVLVGFGLASFLLSVNLLTKGKGMGLGDVKLSLFAGAFLGFRLGVTWMFLSFMVGAFIGIILIVLKAAKLKDKVAFGPFLVVSFFIVMLFGNSINLLLLPF